MMLLSIVLVYEVMLVGQKEIKKCLDQANDDIRSISEQMEVNRLKQDVNSIYFRIKNNNIEAIDNEDTIKEINELKDIRERLKVNSYTQSRLKLLCSLIDHFYRSILPVSDDTHIDILYDALQVMKMFFFLGADFLEIVDHIIEGTV